MDIKKILDEIDGLREKSTHVEWVEEHFDNPSLLPFGVGKKFIMGNFDKPMTEEFKRLLATAYKEDRGYIIALHNSYPTLRDYIARLERENETLKVACGVDVNKMFENAMKFVTTDVEKFREGLSAKYKKAFDKYYHTACEGEEK